ncbi:MAG: hypothetical protein MUO50_09780 [Longimicrobiales bacterium]|nr:hypothetical protein [Longimicrobiales bacterium]
MKVAISVPDELFDSADVLAEHLGISRSQLYATAVAEYVAKFRDGDLTQLLNEVYGKEGIGIGRARRTAQARSVGPTEW